LVVRFFPTPRLRSTALMSIFLPALYAAAVFLIPAAAFFLFFAPAVYLAGTP
jgi:hypothetical protein